MNPLNRFLIILTFLSYLRCTDHFKSISPGQITIGEIRFTGSDGGEKKTRFTYSVPNGYTPGKSFPAVIALHGGGDNMTAFHDLWKSVTDSMGFVLLTPQGDSPGPQNFGWTWGVDGERVVLICRDIVRKAVHVDNQRTYVAGFSAGGRLSYSLGFAYPHVKYKQYDGIGHGLLEPKKTELRRILEYLDSGTGIDQYRRP
jgi:poly(3-hydroxybutyrate) depolymerase